jgi:putative chitinase
MTSLDKATLQKLWPKAPPALIDGVVNNSAAVFEKYHINTPLRVAHFMAQISHESDGGTITAENMNYTTAARIAAVWPSRFTQETAQAYVRKPKELANKVYNGRMGNAPMSDDGFNFRGRGLLQITGKESYQNIGKLTGLDLIKNPDLANAPDTALTVAACEFEYLKCLPACDDDDIRLVTKRVNGGYIGIDSRRNWLTKWKLAIPELPGALPTTDEGTKEINDTHLPREADGDPAKKGMASSTEGWAAIVATVTAIATSVGQMIDAVKPLVSDPRTLAILAVVGAGAGIYIWFRRRDRLLMDHV